MSYGPVAFSSRAVTAKDQVSEVAAVWLVTSWLAPALASYQTSSVGLEDRCRSSAGANVGRVGLGHAQKLIGGVVDPLDRVGDVGRGRRLPTLLDEAVGGVEHERGDPAEAVGRLGLVARQVVGVARDGAEGVGLGDEAVEAVECVAGDVPGGVGEARLVSRSVANSNQQYFVLHNAARPRLLGPLLHVVDAHMLANSVLSCVTESSPDGFLAV